TVFISLHLSSHGDGVGGFNYGWLYDLKSQVNRTSTYSTIDRILNRSSRQVEEQLGLRHFFRDTLRPSPLRPWQSYLPDHPALGGEVSALAGKCELGISGAAEPADFRFGFKIDPGARIGFRPASS
ncbi:MAG: hypothetical protein KAI21_05625, partial [Deltaproteobacteria bacterium]|nr:hypothetical protein [Deltaproteobacteria bacterium]